MPPPIDPRQLQVASLVAACMFMELLDGTIVTTSAPRIAHSLGVAPTSISLVITAYLVTLAALIPASGWMSARFGARPLLLCAIAVFTLASLGCALSESLPELVAMRVLQGVGGAMMVPVGRALVLSGSAKGTIMRLVSYLVWPALVAPVVAPLAGGLITTYLSWHWLFLINLPLGAAALTVALRIVPRVRQDAPGRLDLVGGILTCLGLAGVTITCALLADPTSSWLLDVAAGVPSLILIALAAWHLLHTKDPLLDLHTLRIRTLRFSINGTAVWFPVMAAGPFLAPLLFEEVFGWSPVKAGAVVLLIFVGNLGIKPATTPLYNRYGFRTPLIVSTALMAAMMVAMAFAGPATPVVVIGTILLLSGVARSVGATGYTTMAFGDVPNRQMRDASTLQMTAQQLGAGLGVAGGAIALRIGHSAGELVSSTSGLAGEYRVAFILVAVGALIAALGAVRLHPEAGDVLRAGQARPQTSADVSA